MTSAAADEDGVFLLQICGHMCRDLQHQFKNTAGRVHFTCGHLENLETEAKQTLQVTADDLDLFITLKTYRELFKSNSA